MRYCIIHIRIQILRRDEISACYCCTKRTKKYTACDFVLRRLRSTYYCCEAIYFQTGRFFSAIRKSETRKANDVLETYNYSSTCSYILSFQFVFPVHYTTTTYLRLQQLAGIADETSLTMHKTAHKPSLIYGSQLSLLSLSLSLPRDRRLSAVVGLTAVDIRCAGLRTIRK